ncbi:hypothetical protein RQP46_008997 [Phenoliferia psychrophenolica]
MERIRAVTSHLAGGDAVSRLSAKNADDVVICLAVRSPLCKAGKGAYKDMSSDELMSSMFDATIKALPCDPSLVEDICVGVVQGGANLTFARASAISSGFPVTTSVQTVNRFCSSGLMALSIVANQIRNGEIQCGLAIGVESISSSAVNLEGKLSERNMAHQVSNDSSMPMGWTAENVATDFDISRERMDAWAALSHQRAARAQTAGTFAEEIIPLISLQKDPSGAKKPVTVTVDDGIRQGTTAEGLAKVRSAFPQWGAGRSTGGNSSQVTDGAAAVLLMKRSRAVALGVPILGKHIATSVAGLAPRIMGIGPSIAIPKVLERCGLTKADVDLWEINEAFSSMMVYCVEKLGLDPEKVNVNGGAIALGHPFGCTGARQVATGLSEIRRRKGRVLVTSMCIGAGMGAAAVFIAE